MRKLIAAPAVVFKGSGWAKKDRSATAVPGKSQAQKAASEPAQPAGTTTSSADTPTTKAGTSEPTPGGSKAD